jgi:hypothetical protein
MPYDPTTNPLNSQEWIFPVLEVVHISCFALSVGLVSVVNLRLAGATFPRSTAIDLNRQLFLWTLAGLLLVLTAGMMLFTMDPYRYFYNPAFRFKMIALVLAIAYQYTVHSRIIGHAKEGGIVARLGVVVSTALWVSVVFGGIFFAFE